MITHSFWQLNRRRTSPFFLPRLLLLVSRCVALFYSERTNKPNTRSKKVVVVPAGVVAVKTRGTRHISDHQRSETVLIRLWCCSLPPSRRGAPRCNAAPLTRTLRRRRVTRDHTHSSISPTQRFRAQLARAKKGNTAAQAFVSDAYYLGQEGVTKDIALAFKFCRMAAEAGHTGCQRNLGIFYGKGEEVGVTRGWLQPGS